MPHTTLVSTEELGKHLDDPHWIVFDCRFTLSDTEAGRRAYEEDHIPGARYAHLDDDLSSPVTAKTGRHPLPDPDALTQKLGDWGVDESVQVVVYDDSFGSMAARLWWLLRWLGHEQVALLDGGYQKWRREGRPITPDLPQITSTTFKARRRDALWIDSDAVAKAMADGGHVLIDARSEERFSGEVEPLDKVAGHIPGAVNVPYEDNLDISTDFLPPAELRPLYEQLLHGVGPEKVIHMCGSGVTACHNVLAMEHAGLRGARLYAGSWSEWITDPGRSVAKDS